MYDYIIQIGFPGVIKYAPTDPHEKDAHVVECHNGYDIEYFKDQNCLMFTIQQCMYKTSKTNRVIEDIFAKCIFMTHNIDNRISLSLLMSNIARWFVDYKNTLTESTKDRHKGIHWDPFKKLMEDNFIYRDDKVFFYAYTIKRTI